MRGRSPREENFEAFALGKHDFQSQNKHHFSTQKLRNSCKSPGIAQIAHTCSLRALTLRCLDHLKPHPAVGASVSSMMLSARPRAQPATSVHGRAAPPAAVERVVDRFSSVLMKCMARISSCVLLCAPAARRCIAVVNCCEDDGEVGRVSRPCATLLTRSLCGFCCSSLDSCCSSFLSPRSIE